MSQLSPNETYPIFHGIIDHTDINTYYVQTVIYDTNYNVLDTVNLEDKGNQNFLKMWKVIYDSVFQRGRYILLVTSTYTDSGYTTKSPDYGDEFETHLVHERWDPNRFPVGGGGGGVGSKELRKIMNEEIGNRKFPALKFPKQKEYDNNFNEILQNLNNLKTVIGTLPTENIDLSPVMTTLDTLAEQIQTKPVTPETDINPVLKKIDEAQVNRDTNNREMANQLSGVLKVIEKAIGDNMTKALQEKILDALKTANFSIPMTMNAQQNEDKGAINKLKSKFGL